LKLLSQGCRKNNKILILGRGEELENVNLSTGFFQTPVNSILLKRKKWKKAKNILEFRFALFRLEAKITQVKRSEKFEVKISEKKRKMRSEILKWNCETHVKRIQIRFISLISEKIFKRNGLTLVMAYIGFLSEVWCNSPFIASK
jgi:hypothetical protein